jgi:hypothetical protein
MALFLGCWVLGAGRKGKDTGLKVLDTLAIGR